MSTEILTDTVLEWFQTLDYEFMILHIIICYGVYYSENLRWIVDYFSPVRRKGRSKAIWLVGGILAIFEIIRFIPFMDSEMLIVQKIVSIIHSYILIQVFVEGIVEKIHTWVSIFKRKVE